MRKTGPTTSACNHCGQPTENTICDACRCRGCGWLKMLCECPPATHKKTPVVEQTTGVNSDDPSDKQRSHLDGNEIQNNV